MNIYLSAFFRVALSLLFAWSLGGKLLNIRSFIQAINGFNLLPVWLHSSAAYLFAAAEALVLIALVVGGRFLPFGFLTSALVLIVFTIAMITVLFRKLETPCNCFGQSKKLISYYDVFRNFVFVLFSFLGLFSLHNASAFFLSWFDWMLISIIAAIIVLLLIQLEELLGLFFL